MQSKKAGIKERRPVQFSGERRRKHYPEPIIADVSGVLIIDKPAGLSSAKVVGIIKRLLKAHKVGHAGTLDPMATGVLVCCLNRATRLSYFLLQGSKTYEAVLRLGVETDTQDATGEIIGQPSHLIPGDDEITGVMRKFEGPIQQTPPVYSALKHGGVPLYKWARRGKPVQKAPREVRIQSIRVDSIDWPYVDFTVSCSAGAYIRTLCADIGAALGCGGHLHALRRVASSGFSIKQAIQIDELEQKALSGSREALHQSIISPADALPKMPASTANDELAAKIRHGGQIRKSELAISKSPHLNPNGETFIKIVDTNNHLLAIVESDKGKQHYRYWGVFN